jgi:hypothetical protein
MSIYTYCDKINSVVERLLRHDLSRSERQFVQGIQDIGLVDKRISYRQLQVLGAIYKKHVQRGQYKHHNWPIWNGRR